MKACKQEEWKSDIEVICAQIWERVPYRAKTDFTSWPKTPEMVNFTKKNFFTIIDRLTFSLRFLQVSSQTANEKAW